MPRHPPRSCSSIDCSTHRSHGAPRTATQTTYDPTGYKIYVVPGAPPADPSLTEPDLAWPLATSLADFGSPAAADRGIVGLREGVVLDDDAAALAPILAQATTLTAFTSDGMSYTLYVRPLLPDEVGG